MPEILLNKETFESLSSRFNTAFSRAGEAAEFAYKAETETNNLFPLNCGLIKHWITRDATEISNVMQTIVNSFTETDQANRDKALKIREAYIGSRPDFIDDFLSGEGETDYAAKQKKNSSNAYTELKKALKDSDIKYVPVSKYDGERTEQEIIDQLAGDDTTSGSCASVAYAYAVSKGGYDVKDFRGGVSQAAFGSNRALEYIVKLPGVKYSKEQGYNEIEASKKLLKTMEPEKEYILLTGQHASVVRKNGNKYEYLELQTTVENDPDPEANKGWHTLNDARLEDRFLCGTGQENWIRSIQSAICPDGAPYSYLIDVSTLSNNKEFIKLSGYYNTSAGSQQVGSGGGIK